MNKQTVQIQNRMSTSGKRVKIAQLQANDSNLVDLSLFFNVLLRALNSFFQRKCADL